MSDRAITLSQFLDSLAAHGDFSESSRDDLIAYVNDQGIEKPAAWYIRLLVMVGALFASYAFMLFVVIDKEGTTRDFVWGSLFVVAAIILDRVSRRLIAEQFAMAMALAGHTAIIFGIDRVVHGAGYIVLALVVLCVILYPFIRFPLYRFLAAFVTFTFTLMWVAQASWHQIGFNLLVVLTLTGIGLIFLRRVILPLLRPIGYALVLGLAVMLLLFFVSIFTAISQWPTKIALTLALLWLCRWIAGSIEALGRREMVLVIVAILLLGILTTPGILFGAGLLVLGYRHFDRTLIAIGIIMLPLYIILYYYNLNIDLMTKSFILAATGALLLVARWSMVRIGWVMKEEGI